MSVRISNIIISPGSIGIQPHTFGRSQGVVLIYLLPVGHSSMVVFGQWWAPLIHELPFKCRPPQLPFFLHIFGLKPFPPSLGINSQVHTSNDNPFLPWHLVYVKLVVRVLQPYLEFFPLKYGNSTFDLLSSWS